MITPPPLQKNDTIGLVCPSGHMDRERAEACIKTLKEWGYRVKVSPTVGGAFHYFAGTDQQRLEALQDMFDDPSIKAIICGRGGYGMSRIINRLNLEKIKAKPKWVVGYSDITLLHLYLQRRGHIASLHAPMAGAFNQDQDTSYLQYLRSALEGKKETYCVDPHPFNRNGEASGTLLGGNLTMLAHSIGSSNTEARLLHRLLFIEDIGEYLYSLDRMLHQLNSEMQMDTLNGLIVGHFSEMKDTTLPFGQTAEEIIRDFVAPYSFPVAFGFPVGHQSDNVTLKCGLRYTLNVTDEKTVLKLAN